MTSPARTMFGFEIIRSCGSGAYGEVFFCRDISQKKLALKVIEKQKLGTGWERELKGITRYRQLTENSPGLLKIYHVGEDERFFYYTMEPADNAGTEENYIPDTLAFRLASSALPTERLLATLRQLLQAIGTLHSAGYAHRDIKPENILFVHGLPVLADLGLLSPIDGTMTQFAGTLDFLPPEERTASPSSYSRESRQRNDLYAFGKLIYCCVTGNGACDFPSTPPDMSLELPRKLLFRLCLRLCDRERDRRMTNLDELLTEFEKIERTCEQGEKWSDKVAFYAASWARELCFVLKWAFGAVRRHWALSLVCLALAGGATWYFWPSPLFDITQVKTKTYTREDLGIELDIPSEWEILSSATASKWLAEARENQEGRSEQDKNRMEFFTMLQEQGCDYILCDYNETLPDAIAIQQVAAPGKMLMEVSDDELRVLMLEIYKGELGFDTKIYDFKRLNMAGRPCIFIDLSHIPETRINNYLFMLEDKCFGLALTAKNETFAKRRAEFNSVLTTLRFVK